MNSMTSSNSPLPDTHAPCASRRCHCLLCVSQEHAPWSHQTHVARCSNYVLHPGREQGACFCPAARRRAPARISWHRDALVTCKGPCTIWVFLGIATHLLRTRGSHSLGPDKACHSLRCTDEGRGVRRGLVGGWVDRLMGRRTADVDRWMPGSCAWPIDSLRPSIPHGSPSVKRSLGIARRLTSSATAASPPPAEIRPVVWRHQIAASSLLL
jgi:hypothetical protein